MNEATNATEHAPRRQSANARYRFLLMLPFRLPTQTTWRDPTECSLDLFQLMPITPARRTYSPTTVLPTPVASLICR
jgi:hypothetical protein